ncbi:ATP-grasp domain-containing protein [Blastochloris sulfoviridis]|uniref:ATP-grasp domain-containing protein n=1 Tax=Blastochloris sulfoviridis TaxID=50712 RepID=A0A5M6HUK0_9HYPH|nr:ATP-grasp domain-containing protein [Blastochloris sulfoviridis]KAA5599583.1 ATP-grasp domain-containing protein [Blastochloris sulfoviridis]
MADSSDGGRGVLIVGGAHGALALARSLGSRGVPVRFIANETLLPAWSRFVARVAGWPGPASTNAVPFLLEATRTHGLDGWLLVPGDDTAVRLVSQSHAALSAAYRLMLPPWEALQWACDKPLLYRRAREFGLAIPQTYAVASLDEAAKLEPRFPIVLKPHMGVGGGRFVKSKVVRADDRAAFLAAFRAAASEIGGEHVVVQELIAGGGESQFSYAALWRRGAPVAEFVARRARQYPIEFGFTSTYVEVVEDPGVVAAARPLLASIGHDGLVEVEFKRDARDGSFKLLDVNPRPWSWFGLARAAGVDLGAMLWDAAEGREVAPAAARPGTAWTYALRDAVAASQLILKDRLRATDYLASLARVRAEAAFALGDPLPGLIDPPATAWRVLTRRLLPRLASRLKEGPAAGTSPP